MKKEESESVKGGVRLFLIIIRYFCLTVITIFGVYYMTDIKITVKNAILFTISFCFIGSALKQSTLRAMKDVFKDENEKS